MKNLTPFADTALPDEDVTVMERRPSVGVRTTILPRFDRLGETPALVLSDTTRYEPVRQLGAGASGDVLLARDNDIHRDVALKRLRAQPEDASALARFVEEIRTIGQLEHPGIVPIHDVGVDELGHYFFVMKRVDGETLGQVIERLQRGDPDAERRFTPSHRLEVFIQVLRAVHFAHAHGFIHRDLKPDNIMIGRYGEVVVMDWGLAKRYASDAAAPPAAVTQLQVQEGGAERLHATQQGALLGTPAYMSPEQAAGDNDRLDPRSDLYSLCAILYELLTLRHYLGEHTSLRALLFAVLHGPPRLGTAIGLPAGLTPEIYHVLRRGLAKAPADRYQRVDELLAVLEDIQEGRIHLQCHMTAARRGLHEFLRVSGRFPNSAVFFLLFVFALALYGGAHLLAGLSGGQ